MSGFTAETSITFNGIYQKLEDKKLNCRNISGVITDGDDADVTSSGTCDAYCTPKSEKCLGDGGMEYVCFAIISTLSISLLTPLLLSPQRPARRNRRRLLRRRHKCKPHRRRKQADLPVVHGLVARRHRAWRGRHLVRAVILRRHYFRFPSFPSDTHLPATIAHLPPHPYFPPSPFSLLPLPPSL